MLNDLGGAKKIKIWDGTKTVDVLENGDGIKRLAVNTLNQEDTLVSGTLTAQESTVTLKLGGHKSCTVTISGTWTGNIIVESSTDDGVTWVKCWLQNISAQTSYEILRAVDNFTSNGAYAIFSTSGITHYRIRATNITAWTGTANASLTATEQAPVAIFARTSIVQNVLVSQNNNTTANLNAGASFVGTAESTLGVNAIQINFIASQSCTLSIEQSMNGTDWDIIDTWYRLAGVGSGRTFQAVASFFRVIIHNDGSEATTYLRLQSVLCPIVECLPRALSYDGRLKVEATSAVSPLSLPVQVKYEKNLSAINANEWQEVVTYSVPEGYRFTVNSFRCYSATAGEKAKVYIETTAGTFNCATNAFTDGGIIAFPQFGSGLYLKVTTEIGSSVADTITITYTNEINQTGRTCTIVVPKSSLVGTSIEGILEGDDIGIRDITNITHSATGQAGAFKIDIYYSIFNLLMSASANMYQAQSISGNPVILPPGSEIVMAILAGTKTAYNRFLSLSGTLDPV